MSDSGDDSDISRYLDFSDSESKSKKNGSNSSKKDTGKTFKVKKEHASSELKQKANNSNKITIKFDNYNSIIFFVS